MCSLVIRLLGANVCEPWQETGISAKIRDREQ